MTPDDLYARFRSDVFDQQVPYLWSDVEVYQYMDAAQKKFCVLTWGILDSTSAKTTITVPYTGVPQNDAWVPIDPSILHIRRIQRQSDYQKVTPINIEALDNLGLNWDDSYAPRPYTLDYTVGQINYVITNMEPNKLRLLYAPAAADVLQMTVYRLPADITADVQPALEVAASHHEYLLLWMKKLAYDKQDSQTNDPKKSESFEAKFRAYCAEALVQREAREHNTRVVAYGGL